MTGTPHLTFSIPFNFLSLGVLLSLLFGRSVIFPISLLSCLLPPSPSPVPAGHTVEGCRGRMFTAPASSKNHFIASSVIMLLLCHFKTFQFLKTQMATEFYTIKSYHASVNAWLFFFFRKSGTLHLKTTTHPLETRLLIIKLCRFPSACG